MKSELLESLRATSLDVAHFSRVGCYPAPETLGFTDPFLQVSHVQRPWTGLLQTVPDDTK